MKTKSANPSLTDSNRRFRRRRWMLFARDMLYRGMAEVDHRSRTLMQADAVSNVRCPFTDVPLNQVVDVGPGRNPQAQ